MQKWEYLTEQVSLRIDQRDHYKHMAARGADGWELVAVMEPHPRAHETTCRPWLFWKRRAEQVTGT